MSPRQSELPFVPSGPSPHARCPGRTHPAYHPLPRQWQPPKKRKSLPWEWRQRLMQKTGLHQFIRSTQIITQIRRAFGVNIWYDHREVTRTMKSGRTRTRYIWRIGVTLPDGSERVVLHKGRYGIGVLQTLAVFKMALIAYDAVVKAGIYDPVQGLTEDPDDDLEV